jgi:TolB-like protein
MVAEASFGPFVLDFSRGMLLQAGKPVVLGQRGMALLNALLAADGEAVTKAALMDAGWPGTNVEEGNLAVQIATLRKALGTRDDGLEWIATVPRVGYRFVRSELPAKAARADKIPRLAVLAFENIGNDPEQQYLADGIVEDITTALNRFRTFIVIPRSLSFAFRNRGLDARQVAAELDAQYVLEGSVRKAGTRLRIAAQLVDATAGVHLWAQTFDGETADVFAFQDRITADVAGVIEPTVTAAEIERSRRKPASSLDAYDLYLQALAIATAGEQSESARGLDLIERSLSLDPEFPPALAIAATAYLAQFDRQQPGASEENRLRGVQHARRALAGAGTDANTRAMAGLAIIVLGQEYETGLAALRLAAGENPYSANIMGYAAVGEMWAGSLAECERFSERAKQLNPHQPWSSVLLAGIRMSQEHYQEAVTLAAAATALDPPNPIANWTLAAAHAHSGNIDEARRVREALQRLDPRISLSSIRRGQPMLHRERIEVVIEGLRIAGLPEE